MFNYQKYQKTATDKLNYYGQDIHILNSDFSDRSVAKAIVSPIDITKLPPNLVDSIQKHVTCTSVHITNDDYVRWNGEIYKVFNVSPVNLTDTEILVQFWIGV